MSLMTNAQNTLIQGATFNAIVHGDVHHHSGSQLSVIRRTQRGMWAILYPASCTYLISKIKCQDLRSSNAMSLKPPSTIR